VSPASLAPLLFASFSTVTWIEPESSIRFSSGSTERAIVRRGSALDRMVLVER